jgi:hypothetical protein
MTRISRLFVIACLGVGLAAGISVTAWAGHSADCGGGVACSWVDPPASGGSGGYTPPYVAPPVDNSAEIERQREEAEQQRLELEQEREAEARRKAREEAARQMQFIHDRDDAVSTLKGGAIADAPAQLKGLGDAEKTPRLKGVADAGTPVLKDGSGTVGNKPGGLNKKSCPVVADSNVVDACSVELWGSDLPKVAEIENSPAAGKARKGLQAVANHDWPVALAWWQEALQEDPDNAALKRSVDMAQWVIDWRVRNAKPLQLYQASLTTIEQGNAAAAKAELERLSKSYPNIQVPQDSDLELLFDLDRSSEAKDKDGMRKDLDGFKAAHPEIQPPLDSDLEFLLPEAKADATVQASGGKNPAAPFMPLPESLPKRQRALDRAVSMEIYRHAVLQFARGDTKGYFVLLSQAVEAYQGEDLEATDSIHN